MSQRVIGLLSPASQALLAGVLTFAALAKTLALREVIGTLESLGARRVFALPAAAGVAAAGLRAVLTRQQIACNCFGNLRGEILGWRQVALLPCWLALTATAQAHPPAWGPRQGLLGLAVLLAGLACARLPRELRLWHRLRGHRLAIEEGFRPPPRKLANETGVWLLAAAVLAVLLVVDTGRSGSARRRGAGRPQSACSTSSARRGRPSCGGWTPVWS